MLNEVAGEGILYLKWRTLQDSWLTTNNETDFTVNNNIVKKLLTPGSKNCWEETIYNKNNFQKKCSQKV